MRYQLSVIGVVKGKKQRIQGFSSQAYLLNIRLAHSIMKQYERTETEDNVPNHGKKWIVLGLDVLFNRLEAIRVWLVGKQNPQKCSVDHQHHSTSFMSVFHRQDAGRVLLHVCARRFQETN